jgi:hypothetical protein
MSQRIADASAKVARSSYPLPPETDHVLSAHLGQLAELSGELVPHSNVVKRVPAGHRDDAGRVPTNAAIR